MIKNQLLTKLPKELQEMSIKETSLISWVFEIDAPKLYIDYSRTEHAFSKHMYWEKETENFTLYGVGSIEQPFTSIITNSQLNGTGPIKLTSGLFDTTTDSLAVWKHLSESVDYLPIFLRTEVEDRQYVTFNFILNPEDDRQQAWNKQIKLYQDFLTVEHKENSTKNHITFQEELHVDEWLKEVETSVEMLKQSETIDKIVLARHLKVTTKEDINIPEVLMNLRQQQPNTYRFVVRSETDYFIGATPERLLEASPSHYGTVCVAGSIKRGTTEEEDYLLGEELLKDTKNIVEHHYVVKWLTEEMKKLTTSLDDLTQVSLLKNRDIQHLFLPIMGKRNKTVTFNEGINLLHPSPALGGLPKKQAMSWIKEHETLPRGLYGGPLGWQNMNDDTGEVVVGIRSAFVSGNEALLYAGCGIVEASQPAIEREETKVKFQPMLRALGGLDNE